MKKEIAYIKEFAEKMGYDTNEYKFTHCENHRPCYCIELVGTCDSEGEAFQWSWYLDTEEEL